jgi:hypothetical protein
VAYFSARRNEDANWIELDKKWLYVVKVLRPLGSIKTEDSRDFHIIYAAKWRPGTY